MKPLYWHYIGACKVIIYDGCLVSFLSGEFSAPTVLHRSVLITLSTLLFTSLYRILCLSDDDQYRVCNPSFLSREVEEKVFRELVRVHDAQPERLCFNVVLMSVTGHADSKAKYHFSRLEYKVVEGARLSFNGENGKSFHGPNF